jgi:hypothetical protein
MRIPLGARPPKRARGCYTSLALVVGIEALTVCRYSDIVAPSRLVNLRLVTRGISATWRTANHAGDSWGGSVGDSRSEPLLRSFAFAGNVTVWEPIHRRATRCAACHQPLGATDAKFSVV